MAQIPNSMLQLHALAAQSCGIDTQTLLLQHDIDALSVQSGIGKTDHQQFGAWVFSLWKALNDEAGGFLAKPMKSGSFAMCCHAGISAGNLRRALLRSAQFYSLITDDLHISLRELGEEAILSFNITSKSSLDRSIFYDSLMITWLRWSSWLINTQIQPHRINLNYPMPVYADEYSRMYAAPIYENQAKCSIVLSRDLLDRAIVRTPFDLNDFLRNAPAVLVTQYQKDDSFAKKVLMLLDASIQENVFELDQQHIAASLDMSAATLRRHLRAQNTSFQSIKDQWRRRKSIDKLINTDLSVLDIALSLGFSESSAFHKAFKKWTGKSPSDFRSK